ncbi:DNA polymerase IV [Paenibacillus arenilitoris]|uniref:DNA polymerase IV n=1 Tax=Paenibacillus arenilitoris TaxID=2772299 RepID=A0A927CRD4_9BACL|nr:DNA polymerase IV [Paenibacillus arenilitoris]MBD2871433.1 DNA polymerase IV [Paenibacillus arenilitoris]
MEVERRRGAAAPRRVVLLADCQSFYASVEKAERPEYKDKPVVVAGDPERRSGIILAACPIAKQFGVTTAERLGDSLAKCPDLVIIKPRMQLYIDVSMTITRIYQSFTDLVEPYSIDEQFLDVTGSLHLYGTPEALARMIQARIQEELGVYTRFGIAENKILAKTACDNYAKKNDSGIYVLPKEHLRETLWTLPIGKMFMVGSRMTRHFNAMGIDTIGKLAETPLEKLKQLMRRKFGKNSDINAELYWRIANGIDDSPVRPGTHEVAPQSVGHMMTLPRDYARLEEIKVVLLELTELVCQRCRGKGFMGHVVSVGCMGADYDRPSGFSRQMKMADPTNVTNQVYRAAVELLVRHWDGMPVRKVGVSLSQLSADDEYQLSLFDRDREKTMALERATDAIKRKYGDATILRAVSITPAGQAQHRARKIGGHYK